MPDCSDLHIICIRVREKTESYVQYNFSAHCNDFLKAFFDLALEYDSLDDFYRICVAVPLEIMGLTSALYLYDEQRKELQLVCDSSHGVYREYQSSGEGIVLKTEAYECGDSFLMPVFSKAPADGSKNKKHVPGHRQITLPGGPGAVHGAARILGMYSISSPEGLTKKEKFFFVKYTNRIGYNLHNRLIVSQNIDHLKFINTLVMDIEHNVIVPNMYFRHLFNQLRKKITELDTLRDEIRQAEELNPQEKDCTACVRRCDTLSNDLFSYHREMVKHHAHISLFLESLFRREHFERGHLVLRPKRCLVEKEIILPQLEHYISRLRAAHITVERPGNMLDEEFQIPVDIGLLSQVYANLFSNAAKYTREVITHEGKVRKAMAYGREVLKDFPEQGRQSVKFNVFTTGPQLADEEGHNIFQEGVRGKDSADIAGTGHGLSFIRHVVELHGGIVGHEATPEGNNFYFILPVPPADYPASGE